MSNKRQDKGFALLGVLMLAALLAALVAGYFSLTRIDMTTVDASMDSVRGFYAAEAGSNIRAELVRQTFVGYNRPMGSSPDIGGDPAPCKGVNLGGGDFACSFFGFQDRSVMTYLQEPPGNPSSIVIPRGEQFQNLHAQEYRYVVRSEAASPQDRTEAVLELLFKSRLVPLFQFAAFYDKDLEILPGPTMDLEGPVHTNGDLYLGGGAVLNIHGQVTTGGDLYNKRKDNAACPSGDVAVIDPDDLRNLPACTPGLPFDPITEAQVVPWNEMIKLDVEELIVPPPEVLDPTPGQIYWDKADIRIMLDLDASPAAIQVRRPDDSIDDLASATLSSCSAASHSSGFHNNREGTTIEMLDVDAEALLDCLHEHGLMGVGKDLDDSSEGGLVWYLGVDGPDADAVNNYGVRVHGGAELKSTIFGAPEVRGLTVVTNQAAYVQGDYNKVDKKPAAFLSDSLNILSNAWSDSNVAWGDRNASATEINAAFLSGTDTTGGPGGEGPAGQNNDVYNGGLENYPRLHENWTGDPLKYRGSFVSLNQPSRVDGAWVYGSPYYTAPIRDWGYDTDFDSAENLPPLSPRFVYLRQELFVRDFDL